MRRLWVVAALAVLVSACQADGGGPAAEAIAGFSGDPDEVDASFDAIHQHLDERPDELRAAALARLGDEDPNVHYAAMYALSLTAEPGESMEALLAYLASDDVNERFLAAGSLIYRGDPAAIPVLIELLDSEEQLAYRHPPQAAWEFAAAVLFEFTDQDHGLLGAEGFAEVAATKAAWQRWWDEVGHAVEWVEDGRYFRSGP